MGRKKVNPKLKRNSQTTRLPEWIIIWINKQNKSSGRLIEEAMINHYKLSKPRIDETQK